MKIRVGFGFDVHQLVAGRDLWLGGIRLEHEKGLLGHSDADVLLHAITDALLGHHGAVDIGNGIALVAHAACRLGEQHLRIRALETRIAVGEMTAYVAQRRRFRK